MYDVHALALGVLKAYSANHNDYMNVRTGCRGQRVPTELIDLHYSAFPGINHYVLRQHNKQS